MAKRAVRAKLEEVAEPENIYFAQPLAKEFVSSGCTILDCVLGRGYPLGRIVNIVGDRSSSKTGLATEAVINFLRQYIDGSAFYRETEAAFDFEYANSIGMPLDRVSFGDPEKPVTTVEEFARDLAEFIKGQSAANKPGIYVLDSLDALSDEAEMERDIGEGTFGMAKAKAMSILFRTVARKLERTRVLLPVVSQVRENIGVSFGEKYRRSGGKALDFYSTIALWLAHVKTLTRTIHKVERPYGVLIKAKTKKNKIAMPFRECEFVFIFGYGVDDLDSSLRWLKSVGTEVSIDNQRLDSSDYKSNQLEMAELVKKKWAEIEDSFAPKAKKYQ